MESTGEEAADQLRPQPDTICKLETEAPGELRPPCLSAIRQYAA
jgi:hypothetical protein